MNWEAKTTSKGRFAQRPAPTYADLHRLYIENHLKTDPFKRAVARNSHLVEAEQQIARPQRGLHASFGEGLGVQIPTAEAWQGLLLGRKRRIQAVAM